MDYSILSDEQIVKLVNTGDNLAFEFLVRKYNVMANKITRKYTFMNIAPEDLMQEAMIALIKACATFDATKNLKFSTYAYKCMTNKVFTVLKSLNSKNKILDNSLSLDSNGMVSFDGNFEDEEVCIFIPSNASTPEELMIQQEMVVDLKNFINSALSKTERVVFAQYLSGKSYLDIAEKLKITRKKVDNAVLRAKSKISAFIADY